jgi:predicted O-methyltransferase YrrM
MESSRSFRATQVRSEFLRLLSLVREARPRRLVEIGTGRGGTTFLLSHAAASGSTLVTVDLRFDPPLASALPLLAAAGSDIVTFQADSQAEATAAAVRAAAGGRVDVLFVDGDHSCEGVRRDFALYSPLVRPGGLVAFHDIVPDHGQRSGRPTGNSTGGVPKFWSELRASRSGVEEFVDDSRQDGFGIGLLRI